MSEQKPGDGQQKGTPPSKAKSNGTAPTVSARRPLSKAEYARTTKATPDATAVIPAVRDDEKAPEVKPDVDDRPTQTFKAVQADTPAAKPAEKKPAQPQQKADRFGKKPQKPAPSVAKPSAASAAVPTKAPTTPKPGQAKPEQKSAPATKAAPAAPSKPASGKPATSKTPAQSKTPAVSSSTATDAANTRSARLKLSHVEPWSVTKMAFVVSVALMVVSVVAVTVFWLVMQITGVWGALNDSVSNVLADDAAAFDVTDYLGFGRVVGLTLLVSSLNVIFMTALATIAAHLYNLAAGILGGIELTFGERK